ncbi:MAG: hypothetical protein P4L10_01750 [Acidobacteriaceae bacterium]|nr:hypothetical protein [Acidobacteriaceae bacterium]
MQNYFNYFTEIEERFMQRRGQLQLLTTLDWALIEAWREAGVPLAAALRGIDSAFDKYDVRAQRAKSKLRKVNSLAWCAQEVMAAAEQLAEAAIGSAPAKEAQPSGFEAEPVAKFLEDNASTLESAALPPPADTVLRETAARLRTLAEELRAAPATPLEDLDRNLTVLEEKIFAALLTAAPEQELVQLREQAARELAPYRSRMQAVQIRQIEQQFLHKRLMESRKLPRLSLFYMSHA